MLYTWTLLWFILGIGGQAYAQSDAAFYSQLAEKKILPDFRSESQDTGTFVVQDDVVDLDKVTGSDAWLRLQPRITYVFADIVRIPDRYLIELKQQGLVIVARRIESPGRAYMYLNLVEGKQTVLNIFAREWSGRVKAIGFTQPNRQQVDAFDLGAHNTLAVAVAHRQDRTQLFTASHINQEIYRFRNKLYSQLARAYLVASTVDRSKSADALPLLNWIASVAADAPAEDALQSYTQLALQAAALEMFWRSYQASTGYVPYLDQRFYVETAESYLNAIEVYQLQYDRFVDRTANRSDRIAMARLLAGNTQDQVHQKQLYLEQGLNNIAQAKEAMERADADFQKQSFEVELARLSFQAGIERWKYEQSLKMAVDAIFAIFQVASSVATTITTGTPSLDPAALASFLGDLGSFSETLASSVDALVRATDRSIVLTGASENISQLVDQDFDMAEAKAVLEQIQVSTNDILFDQRAWSVFVLESKEALKFAVDHGIAGALSYQTQLEKLAIMGQASLSARMNLIRNLQEQAQIKIAMQTEMATVERTQQLIDAFVTNQSVDSILAEAFLQQLFELKRPFYFSLLNYQAAYAYWALETVEDSLSLLQTSQQWRKKLAEIKQRYADALHRFPTAPQSFQSKIISIDDAPSLDRLRRTSEVQLHIPLTEGVFSGLDRIRLNFIRVWVDEGDVLDAPRSYVVRISNSGLMADRLGDQTYLFQARPLSRIFEYTVDGRGHINMNIDGRLDEEFSFAYYRPTVFSTWSIRFDRSENPQLDLSKVKGLRMEFGGSGIARQL
jgi:hypothetical protein